VLDVTLQAALSDYYNAARILRWLWRRLTAFT